MELTEVPEQDVPLEATLAGPRPKPSQSKFRSDRLAQAYSTRLPASTPPTSLGTSVLPNSTGALRSAVRMGRLEADQLVSNNNSDSDEEEAEAEEHDAARAREFVDALYRGDVRNAGAVAENSDALIAALESAYGAPPKPKPKPKQPPPPPTSSVVTTGPVLPASGSAAPVSSQKNNNSSPFNPARAAAPPSTYVDDKSPREGGGASSSLRLPPPPTSATVVERKAGPPDASHLPSMIVDSPSFAPPGGRGGEVHATIIDSPSFRPARPPTVLATVRESSGAQQQPQQPLQQQQASASEPGKKVSRFKAQRAEL